MKLNLRIFITLISLVGSTYPTSAHQLTLKHIKDENWSLKSSFIQELATAFNADIFVETGTYEGGTTTNALPFFKEIYTIELAPLLHAKAVQRFQNNKKVHVHLGDSAHIFSKILPTLKGKILFWLDGHYSEGYTALGKSNTPILDELKAIKESNIKDAIILVDDIRCFKPFDYEPNHESLKGYPTINELKNAVLDINSEYEFIIFGDTAIAFLSTEHVAPSPLLKACTLSRLYNNEESQFNNILQAEKTIAHAQGEEREALKRLYFAFAPNDRFYLTTHYRLWYGLLLAQENQLVQAKNEFATIAHVAKLDKRIILYSQQ